VLEVVVEALLLLPLLFDAVVALVVVAAAV
jgi:hypothetical protein